MGGKEEGDIYPSVVGLLHCKHTSSYMGASRGGGDCEVGESEERTRKDRKSADRGEI